MFNTFFTGGQLLLAPKMHAILRYLMATLAHIVQLFQLIPRLIFGLHFGHQNIGACFGRRLSADKLLNLPLLGFESFEHDFTTLSEVKSAPFDIFNVHRIWTKLFQVVDEKADVEHQLAAIFLHFYNFILVFLNVEVFFDPVAEGMDQWEELCHPHSVLLEDLIDFFDAWRRHMVLRRHLKTFILGPVGNRWCRRNWLHN